MICGIFVLSGGSVYLDTSHLLASCLAGAGLYEAGISQVGVYLSGIGVICTSLPGWICMICRICMIYLSGESV